MLQLSKTEKYQEPIKWSLHLHLFLESTLSRVGLKIERLVSLECHRKKNKVG